MRRSYILVGLLLCLFTTTVSAADVNGSYKGNPTVHVIVNQVAVNSEVPAIKLDGTTLVPLRVVAENLGATVAWNEETQTATITKGTLPLPTNPKENEKQASPYIEMLASIQKHAQELLLMHERMHILYELYQVAPNYKRVKDDWEQIVSKEVPQKTADIITLLSSVEQLNNNEKAYTTDEYSDIQAKIMTYKDGVNKYDLAADSFAKYQDKHETNDQRNMLLFMYDGFNIITKLEADINENIKQISRSK